MKKLTLLGFIITFFVSCGPFGTEVAYEGEVVNQVLQQEPQKNLSFEMGQDIKLGDFIIKVNKVDEGKSKNEFMQPEEGNKFFSVEVEYTNPTSDKQLNANPFDWTLYDNENYSYSFPLPLGIKQDLNAVTINPNGKVKGWITFEIPKSATPQKIQFVPDFLDNANVEVKLKLSE